MTSDSIFEQEDFDDILDHWQSQRPRRYHFEGESGVQNLEQLVKDIGYDNGIEEFLADNPGAMEALVNWISEWADKGTEWKTKLAEASGYEPETNDEEEDDTKTSTQ